jgi:hypothetical protein
MSQHGRKIVAVLALLVALSGLLLAGCSNGTTLTKGPVHIVVKNAKPVGGVKDITVKKGSPVRFSVTSDVADEIHVHGYNYHKDVTKGGTISFDFPAKIDGNFVIELESRSEQIASLTVEP